MDFKPKKKSYVKYIWCTFVIRIHLCGKIIYFKFPVSIDQIIQIRYIERETHSQFIIYRTLFFLSWKLETKKRKFLLLWKEIFIYCYIY